MKRAIYPLYAAADESRVKPILEGLKKKGVVIRAAQPGKNDVLLLFLSKNMAAEGPEAEAFFRLSAGRALVIPVNLDGTVPPETLQNALMARHALDGRRYGPDELAELIAKAAKGAEKNRLPLILSVAAAVILLVGGAGALRKSKPATAAADAGPAATDVPVPTPTPMPTVDGIEVDLSTVAEVVYVGDQFRYYTFLDGYYMSGGRDNVRSYREVAYDSWDNGTIHFYSTENGQEIPMAELGDVSYLNYLHELKYLTLVNVKGQLPDLSKMRKLREVTIINCEIPDIRGLGGCGIEVFRYEGATVKDFSPLNECANLNNADIAPWGDPAGADLSNFHPAKLNSLSVDGAVDDLSGLHECSKLRNLFVGNAHVADLSFLQGLQLSELRLDNLDRITDLAGLQGMTLLRYIRITNCDRLASLEGLQGLSALVTLEFENCTRLRDISALEGCSSLQNIHFGANNSWYDFLNDVSVLSRLPKLQDIGLYGVNIHDLDFLKELKIKTGIRLGFCINRGADLSGLAAIDTYNYLHANTGGNYAAAAPYLQDKTIRQLMIYDGGLVDLDTLPKVTGELDLCRCRNRDLTGIRELNFNGKLWIQDCPYFSSFDGIKNLVGFGKAGGTLTVENCPRLSDWSGIEGKWFNRIEIERVLSLPNFSAVTFNELTLEKLSEDVLPDLACLDGSS